MGHWNYRIINVEGEYGLYEVYYNDLGKPTARTKTPATFTSSNVEDLRNSIHLALRDSATRDVLSDDDFIGTMGER